MHLTEIACLADVILSSNRVCVVLRSNDAVGNRIGRASCPISISGYGLTRVQPLIRTRTGCKGLIRWPRAASPDGPLSSSAGLLPRRHGRGASLGPLADGRS